MEELVINSPNKSDLGTILDLQKRAYESEAQLYNDYSIPPLTQSLDELVVEFNQKIFLIAKVNDEIVGSVRAFDNNSVCHIGRLIVSPNFQNQGIGSLLLKSIELKFPTVSQYELFTGTKSLKNLHLYKKNGYVVTRRKAVSELLTLEFLAKSIC